MQKKEDEKEINTRGKRSTITNKFNFKNGNHFRFFTVFLLNMRTTVFRFCIFFCLLAVCWSYRVKHQVNFSAWFFFSFASSSFIQLHLFTSFFVFNLLNLHVFILRWVGFHKKSKKSFNCSLWDFPICCCNWHCHATIQLKFKRVGQNFFSHNNRRAIYTYLRTKKRWTINRAAVKKLEEWSEKRTAHLKAHKQRADEKRNYILIF